MVNNAHCILNTAHTKLIPPYDYYMLQAENTPNSIHKSYTLISANKNLTVNLNEGKEQWKDDWMNPRLKEGIVSIPMIFFFKFL